MVAFSAEVAAVKAVRTGFTVMALHTARKGQQGGWICALAHSGRQEGRKMMGFFNVNLQTMKGQQVRRWRLALAHTSKQRWRGCSTGSGTQLARVIIRQRFKTLKQKAVPAAGSYCRQ